MNNLKAKVYEHFQIERKIQIIKGIVTKPVLQMCAVAIIIVAVISWLQIRPLGLVFLMIFGVWFFRNYCNLHIETPPELYDTLNRLEQNILLFRYTNPTMFCALTSGCLGALAVVGHLVSGSVVVLTGLIFAAILSAKYNFNIIKIEPNDLDFSWSENLHYDLADYDDEFMLEENQNNLFVLERAGDLASITLPTDIAENDEDNSDEVPSELLIPDSIPEIDENSTDDDQDDLLPVLPVSKPDLRIMHSNAKTTTATVVRYLDDISDDNMEFKKSHFKRDSSLSTTSSSSEESLSKGLHFPDHTTVDGSSTSKRIVSSNTVAQPIAASQQETNDLVTMTVKSESQNILANNSRLIPSLMTAFVQGVLGYGSGALATHSGPIHDPTHRRLITALDSSDESDFEIIEEEDFQ